MGVRSQLETPLEIVIDGVSRRGVVMKPGKPFDVFVGQAATHYPAHTSPYSSYHMF